MRQGETPGLSSPGLLGNVGADEGQATTSIRRLTASSPGGDDPPDGVMFRRSVTTRELPVPVHGGNLSALAEILALPPDTREFKLILGWVLALPFNSSVLPGLLLIGAPGYGKSTRLRLTTSVWEPSPDDFAGVSIRV